MSKEGVSSSGDSNKKRLVLSTGAALLNQIITGIVGLILPVYIISTYGSEVNGLIASITQFLAVISFMDMGIGAVVQSSLYKPLADNDVNQFSQVVVSARRFYRKLAAIFVIYAVGLAIVYPFTADKFDYLFTMAMVLILSIGNFAQFFFGATSQAIVNADQRSYVQHGLHAFSIVLNLFVSIILIKLGASIHAVKLFATAVFLIRPLGVWFYVRQKYTIDNNVEIVGEPIKQKRNGFLQHLSSVALDNTHVMVLTLFSTMENISIYSVYYSVLRLVKTTFESTVNGLQALMGNLWARGDRKNIENGFGAIEWGIHSIVVFVFSLVGVLLIPFVMLYTRDITDANYIQPVFGWLITAAVAVQCLRLPYMIMVKAAGHYKETQNSALIEMCLNIATCVLFVKPFGLSGIAAGTLIAMLYRSVYLAVYVHRSLLNRPLKLYAKQLAVDVMEILVMLAISSLVPISARNYFSWILSAVSIAVLCGGCMLAINMIFMRTPIKKVLQILRKKAE